MGTPLFFQKQYSAGGDAWLGMGVAVLFGVLISYQVDDLKQTWEKLKTNGFSTPHLIVKEAGIKGMGVFAVADIQEKAPIEFCHSIVMEHRNRYQNDPEFRRYSYWAGCECEECKRHGAQAVLPLGNGCIYNCASSKEAANCAYVVIPKEKLIVFYAIKPIKAEEEILTWWGQGYFDRYCRANSSRDTKLENKTIEATSGSYPSSQTESSGQSPVENGEASKSETTP